MPNTAYNASQKKKRISNIAGILSLFLILLIDQVSKSVIVSRLALGQSIPIIKNVLHITFIKNTGAAFGLFKNSTYFFIAVSVIAVILIGIVLVNSAGKGSFSEKFLFHYSLILIMAGALGNLIDRISLKYVIDFIDFRIWPVFNIADSSITIGTALLIISFTRFDNKINV
ncbi:MAG: signal peptidase II [Candidatus Omnitrophica bacterium CG_4_9_14_0_2_um_filter_42_8]|nr:MAG: signal peptidase II [Candidatus Omnitrophica bacterium CG22_combo_CG10-13_8_21_14_all_43_16]PJC48522.1 MAG: signal peptidase II [Candidatus Omnitrophica bacterium CG_4_9_14_0_2_um_filter_42_8]